ncbi:MAG: glycosyltransferase WbuB [Alcanivorax sp.]|nr:glycosyltransferase WbuB [Alcanivorax sp.]
MSRTVWIINQYASMSPNSAGSRHHNFAKRLAQRGYHVTLISASFSHLNPDAADLPVHDVDDNNQVRYLTIKVPRYRSSTSIKRVFNWFYFALKILFLSPKRNDLKKPDIIYYSSLSLVGALSAERLATRYAARLVFEVRDIWPLTMIELGGFPVWHPLVRLLQYIEDRAYRRSKVIFSNLQNLPQHLIERGAEINKFHWIPNGVDETFMSTAPLLPNEVCELIPKNKFIVGYAGSVGRSNALGTLIDAATILQGQPVAFVIAGDGDYLGDLKAQCSAYGLDNIVFLGRLPKEQIPSLISFFDACYLGWADHRIYRMGVGANKIPEYLISGKPIIHGYSGAMDPVTTYGAGVTVPAENPTLLAQAITELSVLPRSVIDEMAMNGIFAARKYYTFDAIVENIDLVFSDLLSK